MLALSLYLRLYSPLSVCLSAYAAYRPFRGLYGGLSFSRNTVAVCGRQSEPGETFYAHFMCCSDCAAAPAAAVVVVLGGLWCFSCCCCCCNVSPKITTVCRTFVALYTQYIEPCNHAKYNTIYIAWVGRRCGVALCVRMTQPSAQCICIRNRRSHTCARRGYLYGLVQWSS